MRIRLLLAVLLAAVAARAAPQTATAVGQFRVAFDPSTQPGPYSGRIYVVLAKPNQKRPVEPRLIMGSWFDGTQVLAQDVHDVAATATVAFTGAVLGYPRELAEVEPGEYLAQAVARRSLDSPNVGRGAGDLYSKPVPVMFEAHSDGVLELKLTLVVAEDRFVPSDRVQLFEMVSPSLSRFHGRELKLRAGVVLPPHWRDDSAQHHATLYFIPGFGGSHASAHSLHSLVPQAGPGSDVLFVVPDPTCSLGHSVFADSENNGPWGKALVEELIPALERRFHGAASGEHRYVSGISSGGWSSLWLQVSYPDTFHGCWSHCPDPVDFRDFQRIDLYAPHANMYQDDSGARRGLARMGTTVTLWYDDFARQESVLGPGGQLHSFEAVFSRRGADGEPELLFDRETGDVDQEVARSWEKYDLRLVLERRWKTLGNKLKGKLHIYAGELDTFYLEGAVRRLAQSLQQLGSDAEVVIVPGMPHTIHRPGLEAMFRAIR